LRVSSLNADVSVFDFLFVEANVTHQWSNVTFSGGLPRWI
jgi:hypothetical protein